MTGSLADFDALLIELHPPVGEGREHRHNDDEMPDGPIEVTWCSTCGTGAVFCAELKGRRLHFEYDSMVNANEVHRDVETGSRWQ